ncbi:MAG TPA: HEAT repeat domain-containing protein [Burkholderiales bacterium]
MPFATASDPQVAAALWGALAALSAALTLLAAVVAMRVRLLRRLARQQDAAARWNPLLARCTESVPPELPTLRRRDAEDFLLLWCRAQESLRGEAQDRLRELARRLGAEAHARRLLRSRWVRARLIAAVTLGHLQAQDLAPWLHTQIASARILASLVAAKALIRIDARVGLPPVLFAAARREDWPLGSVATTLKEADAHLVGPALSSAILAALRRGDGAGVSRLLRLHVAAEPGALHDAVLAVLAECADSEALAAALAALSHPRDVEHARRLLGHAEWFVRVAAARALGRLGTENDATRLVAALGDTSWWVRHRAAEALAQLPGMNAAQLAALADRQADRFAADALRQTLAERNL